MNRHSCSLLCAALLVTFALQAQSPVRDPELHPTVPTITFDRVWEAYTPQSVNITVQATGAANYISRNPFKPPEEAGPDPDYVLAFSMSPGNAEKLFRDAKAANYFNGDFRFKKHTVSSTGKKTLTYADPARHFETTYDYTENKAIEEITDIFLGISNTIEHGRKLQFLRRFDKLGLEAELKGMENAAASHNLAELHIIAPTLESIANDTAILNIARQRAKRLLAQSSSE
jgi:hypothetical protein